MWRHVLSSQCKQSSLRVFWSTKYYHREVTCVAAFPEQVLICFPNQDISCKYLFMDMPSLHCRRRNTTDFQLTSHQKQIDMKLPSGVLQWMPKESSLSCPRVASVAYSTMVWHGRTHTCALYERGHFVWGFFTHTHCCKIDTVNIQWCGNKLNHGVWVLIILSCQIQPK